MRQGSRTLKIVVLAFAAVVLAAAGAYAAMSTSSSTATVKTAMNSKLHAKVLVTSSGFTLYRLTKDGHNHSNCSAGCAAAWPPLLAPTSGKPTLASGVGGTLATFKRSDGKHQVSYDGMPLYRFAGDKKAGQANGQGVAGVWFAAKPKGSPSGSGSGTPATTNTTSTSGGGGYGSGGGGGYSRSGY
jgi:predicted lipoprotein with Yx(FWY)xxD motif